MKYRDHPQLPVEKLWGFPQPPLTELPGVATLFPPPTDIMPLMKFLRAFRPLDPRPFPPLPLPVGEGNGAPPNSAPLAPS
jgi:hypothetical protein